VKHILIIITLLALCFLIEYLVEDIGPRRDMLNIVGSETDSVGGHYIYFDNGDVYHRRKVKAGSSSLNYQRGPRTGEFQDAKVAP
jgi:hypothetical protein